MSKRTGFNMATVNDYRDDDYGDYDQEYDKKAYGDEDYYNEMTEEEQIAAAKKLSNKQAKEEKKKNKSIKDDMIQRVYLELKSYFDKDQVKGSLETFRATHPNTYEQESIKSLKQRQKQMAEKGKENKSAKVKADFQSKQKEIEEQKKAADLKANKPKMAKIGQGDMAEFGVKKVKDEIKFDKEAANRIYEEFDYFQGNKTLEDKCLEGNKNNLNLVIIGHVDSGKSTMTGHLLYKAGLVKQNDVRKNAKEAEQNKKTGFEFAYIMDETEEERERGVTIELTTRYFNTPNRNFTLLDAPGHREFVANMITGAAQANCGILVLDSRKQAFEAGFMAFRGTTCEHATLAKSLGVQQLICAVNKMEMDDWSQDRFDEIQNITWDFLKNLGFKKENIYFIPISGLQDENMMERARDPKLKAWYDGPCLVEILDTLKVPPRTFKKPVRATVMEYIQKTSTSLIGDCVLAKIEAGVLFAKNENPLALMPQICQVGIRGIMKDGRDVEAAVSGQIVEIGLKLPADFDINYLKKGNVICDMVNKIPMIRTLNAKVVILDIPQGVLSKGEQVLVHSYTSRTPGRITHLLSTIDQHTGAVIKNKPKWLKKGDFANIQIRLEEHLCLELHENYKSLGRITIRKGNFTIACGTTVEFLA